MTTNRNDLPETPVSQDMLDALFARTTAQAMADREARRRAAEWPSEIEQLLATLAERSTTQADALAGIHTRLTALEASMGIKPA